MKDDRTVQSDGYWDEEFERSGGQARPFFVSGADAHLLEAIDHAIGAGACRVEARRSPASAATWNAVAEAKTRQAKTALEAFMRAKGARPRAR